ncbi:hypothetical protein DPMN_106117 [Dreissena polymorpha]|uniref:Uncharacterized protein n=1 Tax=Dreissena polymorpha TaxID=45954 RepID=A0A9D4K4E1_DREPO|nr:hypothetical protein DPMN_106117 [Dreissena polymorpha]
MDVQRRWSGSNPTCWTHRQRPRSLCTGSVEREKLPSWRWRRNCAKPGWPRRPSSC